MTKTGPQHRASVGKLKPKAAKSPQRKKHQIPDYVVLDGRFFVAVIKKRSGATITADLYQNLDDFKSGTVMERGVILDL